jgi:hypothetical protein
VRDHRSDKGRELTYGIVPQAWFLGSYAGRGNDRIFLLSSVFLNSQDLLYLQPPSFWSKNTLRFLSISSRFHSELARGSKRRSSRWDGYGTLKFKLYAILRTFRWHWFGRCATSWLTDSTVKAFGTGARHRFSGGTISDYPIWDAPGEVRQDKIPGFQLSSLLP